MERFEDAQACRLYMASLFNWSPSAIPDWDALTEDHRQVYRDFVNRLPSRQYDPSLSEKFSP